MPLDAEEPADAQTAAVLTVGTELTEGLRVDTNAPEIAAALSSAGRLVVETVSVGDDVDTIASAISRLLAAYDIVVVTGGLGPTHDDLTRDAAALALGVTLVEDAPLRERLAVWAKRHRDEQAAEQVFRQALVIPEAAVIPPSNGTAPGLVVEHEGATLALLPGPPVEMRPMLTAFIANLAGGRAQPRILPCAGISESDAQVLASRALEGADGVSLTVLARPSEVEVVLIDRGAGGDALAEASERVEAVLGHACYARHGATLEAAVLALAGERDWTLATAESCTGGMVAARITRVPGSSKSFLGGAVAYSNEAKRAMLGVASDTLSAYGAVSAETASDMARGARHSLGADLSISVTGIAGPSGGSAGKPVGLVWFGLDGPQGRHVEHRMLPGDRDGIRERAATIALDLLRRYMEGTLGADDGSSFESPPAHDSV